MKEKSQISRRDFMKLFGYSAGVMAIFSACEQPIKKAIPFLVQPEEVVPGKASFYASTYFEDGEYNSIVVKVRDGRPIKIEGNELSKLSRGATSARVQASVLSLYDPDRLKYPSKNGIEISWEELDKEIISQLETLRSENKKVVLLSKTVISPTTTKVFETFTETYPNVELVFLDSWSYSAIREANRISFGKPLIPQYHFDKARLIISLGADFLGTWLSPLEFTYQFSNAKKQAHTELIQLESGMSLTGSNADKRMSILPGEEKEILLTIYKLLSDAKDIIVLKESIRKWQWLVDKLKINQSKSLLVSGSQDRDCQLLVNQINYLLGNYSKTIIPENDYKIMQADDHKTKQFINYLKDDKIAGLICYGTDLVYEFPNNDFEKYFAKMQLILSVSTFRSETTALSKWVAPDHFYLESWNDAEPVSGQFSLVQPVIKPLFNTRQGQDSLLYWSGHQLHYRDFMKRYWLENVYPRSAKNQSFKKFWLQTLQKGVLQLASISQSGYVYDPSKTRDLIAAIKIEKHTGISAYVYESNNLKSGLFANNPWLQELPDPVSKVAWGNYASISKGLAEKLNLKTGDLIKINDLLELPVLTQPGHVGACVGIAIGYGREHSGSMTDALGVNAWLLIDRVKNHKNWVKDIKIEKLNKRIDLAINQMESSMKGRRLVQEMEMYEYLRNDKKPEKTQHSETFYDLPKHPIHHWALVVDLNACTGCSACIIACQAENNIPVVGREEMIRNHEMHWIRVDRYYEGDNDHPEVLRQPVMCQHCDHAPCENVCPVSATTHSSDGINQMIYNRCIGTRYCANNCPYKVRRFNWYDYTGSDFLKNNSRALISSDLPRMVLNPDVTVRSKGVIEKCSFCIQRIQEATTRAKKENRAIQDGEIKPACMQVCPANAIYFGDLNDKESKVSKLTQINRNYQLLEELHTLPTVSYMKKVRKT